MKVGTIRINESDAKDAMSKQIDEWQKTAARYRSEPETREGTTELAERAMEAEHERDTALARYHNYEIASAAFQIGIVLCSAAVITGMLLLAWAAGGVAILGIVFTTLGLFAPHVLHLG
jgi:ABC-type nickel/cobalt efflux system permease component RcnA